MVTFEEIPTEVTLSLSISNCQGKCPGCHSPELRCNIGTELTNEKLDELITKNSGISCVHLFRVQADQKKVFPSFSRQAKLFPLFFFAPNMLILFRVFFQTVFKA